MGNKTEFLASADLTEEEFQENPIINWDAILWVNRPVELWGVQLVLALISLTEALLITYLGYKVSTKPQGTRASSLLAGAASTPHGNRHRSLKLTCVYVWLFLEAQWRPRRKQYGVPSVAIVGLISLVYCLSTLFNEDGLSKRLLKLNFHFHPFQGNIWQQILSFHFILELVTTVPFALTVSLLIFTLRLIPVSLG